MATMSQRTPATGDRVVINVLLALLVILVPLAGHLVLTVMILRDDLSPARKLLWLLVVWLVWFVGPFLYLLLGQRRNRLFDWGA